MESLLWYNDHPDGSKDEASIYNKNAGYMNDLYWEINDVGGKYCLNLFFEVPTYARRMIWAGAKDVVKYDGTNFDPNWDIPIEYLDAYLAGSHHKEVKMDYETQTGSELFQLLDAEGKGKDGLLGSDLGNEIFWQDEDVTADDFTWKTSREYLISKGLASVTESLNYNVTASIELKLCNIDSRQTAWDFVDNIDSMRLHLSDEAVGLPSVPDSGTTLVLLGIAATAAATFRRRRAS